MNGDEGFRRRALAGVLVGALLALVTVASGTIAVLRGRSQAESALRSKASTVCWLAAQALESNGRENASAVLGALVSDRDVTYAAFVGADGTVRAFAGALPSPLPATVADDEAIESLGSSQETLRIGTALGCKSLAEDAVSALGGLAMPALLLFGIGFVFGFALIARRAAHTHCRCADAGEIDGTETGQKSEASSGSAIYLEPIERDLFATASHELRTPLNSIIGFVGLALDDIAVSREEEKLFLRNAQTSARALLSRIKDRYALESVCDGQKALEASSSPERKAECLLLDLMMPVKDGRSVIRDLCKRGGRSPVPIIVITGFPEAIGAEERERLPRAGVVQVLSKEAVHLDPSVLVKALDQAFVQIEMREDRS